jgi:hypothetical protein
MRSLREKSGGCDLRRAESIVPIWAAKTHLKALEVLRIEMSASGVRAACANCFENQRSQLLPFLFHIPGERAPRRVISSAWASTVWGTEMPAKGWSGCLGLSFRRKDVCFRHRARIRARGHSLILACILQAAARNRRGPAFLHML